MLSLILDGRDKPGIISEIRGRLIARSAMLVQHDLYDAEEMKVLLEEMCAAAAVDVRLYSRVAAADIAGRTLHRVIIEAKEGRFALAGKCFIDATGDGDLAALAG